MIPKTDHFAGDPLLECLTFLTALHGRSKSGEALLAGLADDGRGVTPSLFLAAAQRAGLSTTLRDSKRIENIPPQVLPYVVILNNRRAAIILTRKNEKLKIWDPESQTEKQVPLEELEKDYAGAAILVKPRPDFIDPSLSEEKDFVPRRWFWESLEGQRPAYIRVFLASFLINLFALVSPIYIMNVYDRVIPNQAIETGWALAIGAVAVFLIDFIIRTLRGYFVDYAGRNIDIQVARRLFDQILDMKLSARPSSSGATANMLREFDGVRDFLTSATMVGVVDIPFAILFVTAIFFFGGPMGLVVLVLMALSVATSMMIQIPLRRYVRRSLRSAETRHGLLVETIYGLETIKSMAADGKLRARYAAHVAENAGASLSARHYSALGVNIATLVQQIATVVIVLIGMYMVRDGALSMGALIACVILSGRAIGPMVQVANLMGRYHQSMAALRTLDRIMAAPQERPPGKDFLYRPDLKGAITFDRVTFSYPGTDRSVLDSVSFSIAPGEKVGIIGRIGSGKSTIARLLLKLHDPQAGRILVDGTDAAQIDPADLRRKIAYVAQEATLFQGTVRDNITAGHPQAKEEDILAAAKAAGAHGFIAAHPMGYDAPVGERGDGLSGGQKQCIALARALLMKPELFVCDEPTNAMDLQTEENFARMIREQAQGRGLILITHRMSLLPLVDRLILIDQGRVVADGPRDQVLQALTAKAGGAA